jgi:hypothetical protein
MAALQPAPRARPADLRAVGYCQGLDSDSFALAFVFALIVMYDACHVSCCTLVSHQPGLPIWRALCWSW